MLRRNPTNKLVTFFASVALTALTLSISQAQLSGTTTTPTGGGSGQGSAPIHGPVPTFPFTNLAFVSGTLPGNAATIDALTGVSMPNNMLMEFQIAQYNALPTVKLFRFNYIDGAGTSLSSGSGKVVSLASGNTLTAMFGVSYKASTDIATVTISKQLYNWTINLVVSNSAGVPYFSRQGVLNPGYAVLF